ncbi:hypothetical protein PAPYR_5225 [Paratrimastix pyriformis]|uniref:Uncharacterized protein n=1 Tax=Paratrimastix pyriformis TaxID=342808 RepID=A0ABQ8UML1_9EUKA|nr:hypothetical protein PAPYR_5225 [Paratrimastix pyriformis]
MTPVLLMGWGVGVKRRSWLGWLAVQPGGMGAQAGGWCGARVSKTFWGWTLEGILNQPKAGATLRIASGADLGGGGSMGRMDMGVWSASTWVDIVFACGRKVAGAHGGAVFRKLTP